MQKEIEIKIKLDKKDNITNRLKELGGQRETSYTQTTFGFFSDNSLEKGIFPRIRIESKEPVLTVKVRNKKQTNYFERDEYSMKIGNLATGIKILKLLGFETVRKFTKKRENWIFKNRKLKISLDRLYFGRFIELEGSKEEIEKAISELGFQNRERITKTYLALEDDYKKTKA